MTSVDELEVRIAHLEELEAQRRDMVLDAQLKATAYGVTMVHVDTQALRVDMSAIRADLTAACEDIATLRTELTDGLAAVRSETTEGLDKVSHRFDDLEHSVAQVLNRLPQKQ